MSNFFLEYPPPPSPLGRVFVSIFFIFVSYSARPRPAPPGAASPARESRRFARFCAKFFFGSPVCKVHTELFGAHPASAGDLMEADYWTGQGVYVDQAALGTYATPEIVVGKLCFAIVEGQTGKNNPTSQCFADIRGLFKYQISEINIVFK